MTKKILCVDDDANVLAAYSRNLRKEFTLDTALGGEPALAAIRSQGPYAVIVSDMQMPGMNGIQFLTKAKEIAPDAIRIMLTGNADQKTATDAVNEGSVFRFLTKPCPPEKLAQTLNIALEQHRLITAERELLEKTLHGSVKLLTDILSLTDPQSFGQAEKLRDCMRTYLGTYQNSIRAETIWEFELAAMLANIGSVAIPPSVISKTREGISLTGAEKDMLIRVPETGASLLANIPRLESVANIVRYQVKHYDGTGFPMDEVKGDDLPLAARILKILLDMLQLEAKGMLRFKALEQLQQREGWYDPNVLDSVFTVFQDDESATVRRKPEIRVIMIKELQVNHTLSSNLMTNDDILIAPAGTKISQMILTKIQNFEELSGIKQPIYIAE